MRCKCCGEKADFTFVEDNFLKNRYNCSNCDKYFWVDKEWLEGVKAVKSLAFLATVGVALGKLAAGDVPGAIETAFKIDINGNDTTFT